MSYLTKEYVENVTEEEGDYVEDALATALYMFTMTGIIVGEGFFYKALGYGIRSSAWILATPPAMAAWVPVLVGGGISYWIDEEEGVKNYVDFLEDVVTLDYEGVKEKVTFTVETLGDELLETFDESVDWVTDEIGDLVEGVSNLGAWALDEVVDIVDEIFPSELFEDLPKFPSF